MTEPGGPGPLVTVGVFAYNHAPYIVEAVASVLDSTFPDIEVWVVDDGSKDRTADVAGDYLRSRADPRASLLADGRNKGLPARINEVAERARGEWLAILGGDDAYLADGLETLASAIEPGVDVIWGDLDVMDQSGGSAGYSRPRDTWQGPAARRYLRPGSPVEDIYRHNNFISGTSPLVRLAAVRAVGGYREGCRNEDLDMWLRLGRDHAFKYVGASVARYRVVPGSNSRSEGAAIRDQAELASRLLQQGGYSEQGLARLVAMRWALSVGRTRGRPPASLGQLSEVSGIPAAVLWRELPRAAADPLVGSVAAGAARIARGLRPTRGRS